MVLRRVKTSDLVRELQFRHGVRSIEVCEDEFSKIQVSGRGEEHLRYIKGCGPTVILEVKI